MVRHETPQRSEVDDHAVVEVRVPERRHPHHLIEKPAKLSNERLLFRDRLPLRGGGILPGLTFHRRQPALLVPELSNDVVVLNSKHGVPAERMNVEPPRITRRWGCQLPVDRRLATTL